MSRISQGYGMPFSEFIETTKLPLDPGGYLSDGLKTILAGTENLLYGQLVITDWRGLAELFIGVGDNTNDHIMIFPTIAVKYAWNLISNPIDAFVSDPKPSRYTKATYLDIPFCRYNHYMDGNGVEVSAPLQGGDPALVPGVPDIMREWLIRYGVFDRLGVVKLRPMVAEWAKVKLCY